MADNNALRAPAVSLLEQDHLPAAAKVEALLIPADVAGPMCGRSEASWWRDHAAGRIPAPVKLGGRTYWRAQELREWVEANCPCRRDWEALRGRKGGGR